MCSYSTMTVSPDRIEFKKGAAAPDEGGKGTPKSTVKRVDKSSPMLMQGTAGGNTAGSTAKELDKSSPQ